jgi:oligogalacturonide lyase
VADGQPATPVLPETGNDKVETMANNIPNLYLIDPRAKSEEILCRHGSSFKPYGNAQDCHPHPSFTPDSKAVVFCSDREGRPAVYIVEI